MRCSISATMVFASLMRPAVNIGRPQHKPPSLSNHVKSISAFLRISHTARGIVGVRWLMQPAKYKTAALLEVRSLRCWNASLLDVGLMKGTAYCLRARSRIRSFGPSTPTWHNSSHLPQSRHLSLISLILRSLFRRNWRVRYTVQSFTCSLSTVIGQASIHTPQFGQEKNSTRANPLRELRTFSPALRIGISSISVGICIYRVNGNTHIKIHNAIEYAHQVGNIYNSFPKNCRKSQLAGTVRNEPPEICAVKLSASQRNGKIAHNEYSPITFRNVGRAMRLTPNI